MRNKRFPKYPDDADYNTNSPSYYDDLARKQKLIQLLAEKIWNYDERLDERLEDLENVLQDYLSQWDTRIENLDDEVSHIFVTWLNDGTLEQIINHDVLGNKADKTFVDSEIERLEQKDADIISQLDQTVRLINADMTMSEIQDILDMGGNIKFLKGDYELEINPVLDMNTCLDIASDSDIFIETGSSFTIPSNNLEDYIGFRVMDKSNVKITNGLIIGDRNSHDGTTGEWGHGLSILGSNNVTIENIKVIDCWGDGIYIGKSYIEDWCFNVTLKNPICDNNRRQGISVISVKNLYIYDAILTNTNGTAPAAGIDLEPNDSNAELYNINIINLITENNAGAGLLIAPYYLGGSRKQMGINVDNHVDEGSKFGLHLGTVDGAMLGAININEPIYTNNKRSAIFVDGYDYRSSRVEINKPTIDNSNTEQSTGTSFNNSVIAIGKLGNFSSAVDVIGNIHINQPMIYSENVQGYIQHIFAFDSFVGSGTLQSISVIDPKINVPNVEKPFYLDVNDFMLSDNHNDMVKHVHANLTVHANEQYATYTNENAGQNVQILLPESLTVGTRFTFVVSDQHYLTVTVPETHIILPNQIVAGKGIRSNKIGSQITMVKKSTNQWFIENEIGEWLNSE